MRFIFLIAAALFGVSSTLQAREMTHEEAQERARIVAMGGD